MCIVYNEEIFFEGRKCNRQLHSKFILKGKTMKKRANITIIIMAIVVCLMLIQCGCGSKSAAKTGFLSNYSHLKEESDTSLRYINEGALARYSSFIVDPVDVHYHSGSKSKGKLTEEQIKDLTGYMHSKILEAFRNAGKGIAYRPAPGVARIRVALTDINPSSWASLVPQTRLILGTGLGGASMEAEIVDSMTGEQIGAVVESKLGSRIPFTELGKWDSAKAAMDSWGKRLQERLQ